MPFQFNVRTTPQFVTISNSPDLNPQSSITVEAACTLLATGDDPTVIALPAAGESLQPSASYRLGFHGDTCCPEFQLLFEGDSEITTIRAESPVNLNETVHIAGTYDGKSMKLFVNGVESGAVAREGRLALSGKDVSIASRSPVDPDGLFVGILEEIRFWNVSRDEKSLNKWKHRLLPVDPLPEGLVGLWDGEPSIGDPRLERLASSGFSDSEIRLLNSALFYCNTFNSKASDVLRGDALTHYSDQIRQMVCGRTSDGWLILYLPDHTEAAKEQLVTSENREEDPIELRVYDWSSDSTSKIVEELTGGQLTISSPAVGASLNEIDLNSTSPIPRLTGATVNPRLQDDGTAPTQLTVHTNLEIENGRVIRILPGRIRVLSPLVTLSSGSVERQFTWLFADFWFGELTREVLHLPNIIAPLDADLMALQWIVDIGLPREKLVNNAPRQATASMRETIDEFRKLIDRQDVDEVQHIQPFLSDPRRWFLLSPHHKNVWPQKMLGNRWKVDFVVQDFDDSYVAIEIESPKFPVYTKSLDPHHKLTHAEQQVRDYCEYVDQNRDTVEREEGLPKIYRPKGCAVIGRRRMLSADADRKLVARNRDAPRYSVMVYDDLIDRANAMVAAVEAALPK